MTVVKIDGVLQQSMSLFCVRALIRARVKSSLRVRAAVTRRYSPYRKEDGTGRYGYITARAAVRILRNLNK
jgi:hypothetical protein